MKQEPAFTAVQENPTSFCMDWPVFEADGTRDNHFQGTVFVLDCQGALVGDAPLPAPRNRSADEALNRIGWVRSGAWHRDGFGRQVAKVESVRVSSFPRQAGVMDHRGSLGTLAEEAALHLG